MLGPAAIEQVVQLSAKLCESSGREATTEGPGDDLIDPMRSGRQMQAQRGEDRLGSPGVSRPRLLAGGGCPRGT